MINLKYCRSLKDFVKNIVNSAFIISRFQTGKKMQHFAIHTDNLSKVYRLYSSPLQQFLGQMGLGRYFNITYGARSALDHVNLTIRRGEKVGIIGRNGAGKSTFLKIVSGVTEPSSGSIKVQGKVHALLTIGTGFHPDFTGRENIYAYLANQGLSGKKADALAEEIIDFAEIEEYIDQPLRTYSTGMGVRLMFATSTVITPDILILDEVLGVGDAYFVQKSLEHMKNLCLKESVTLLMVSHDVYATSRICERIIWIDRGCVLQDGPALEVIKAYEASVRLQEEDRLRKRALKSKEFEKKEETGDKILYCQIVPQDRVTQHPGLLIGGIRVFSGETLLAEVPLDEQQANDGSGLNTRLVLEENQGNWGAPKQQENRLVRPFESFGSTSQRAPFIVEIPREATNFAMEIDAAPQGELPYYLELYTLDCQTECHKLALDPAQGMQTTRMNVALKYCEGSVACKPQVFGLESQQNICASSQRLGNKRLTIETVTLLDNQDSERYVYALGETMCVRVLIKVNDPDYEATPEIMVAFNKEGVTPKARVFHDQTKLIAMRGAYVFEAFFEPLLLCAGTYAINVGVYNKGYYESAATSHVATSSSVIDLVREIVFFEVKTNDYKLKNIEFFQPVRWETKITSLSEEEH